MPPGRDETDRLRRRVEVEPGGAAGGTGDPRLRVHVDVPHRREVDHEAVVADAMPSGIVPTTANRDLQSVLACELERRGHVVAAETARDHRGPASDERVEPAAGVFVAVVARRDDRA